MALVSLLPGKFQAVPAWSDFAGQVETLMQQNLWGPITQLAQVRRPYLTERTYLILTAKLLGLDIKSDGFPDQTVRVMVEHLTRYYAYKGTDQFAEFLGFINNTRFTLKRQWTTDYKTFYDEPGGTTWYDGGTWYVTPHVVLTYDATQYTPDPSDLKAQFYLFAPIHLVLDKLERVLTGSMNLYVSVVGVREIIFW